MKNIFPSTMLLFFFFFLAGSCNSQDTAKASDKEKVAKVSQEDGKTPQAVKDSFKRKYPGENDPDWETDRNDNYEAHFKKGGIHYKADFSPEGNWIETENSIDKKDLPKAVKEAIKEKYKDVEIVEIEKVDHHSKGIFYDVEFKKKGEKFDVEFNAQGQKIN